ncbi:unnamed protein product [Prunus armeniaca]|uniref:Uncharacterized protein n=1 Tax=Prunus armeniaca TaxID=36596 RepID=A0A6J5TX48_PRUAR|nr:unnamed protein product [Prunus armeniaca]
MGVWSKKTWGKFRDGTTTTVAEQQKLCGLLLGAALWLNFEDTAKGVLVLGVVWVLCTFKGEGGEIFVVIKECEDLKDRSREQS